MKNGNVISTSSVPAQRRIGARDDPGQRRRECHRDERLGADQQHRREQDLIRLEAGVGLDVVVERQRAGEAGPRRPEAAVQQHPQWEQDQEGHQQRDRRHGHEARVRSGRAARAVTQPVAARAAKLSAWRSVAMRYCGRVSADHDHLGGSHATKTRSPRSTRDVAGRGDLQALVVDLDLVLAVVAVVRDRGHPALPVVARRRWPRSRTQAQLLRADRDQYLVAVGEDAVGAR